MSEAVLSLALVSHHEDENNPTTSGASDSPADKKKAPSLWAAVARALYGSLAFLYRAPLRMFRPTKISISLGLQALLNEQGKKSLTPSVVRGIIRKEGWRFFPRHVLPPVLANAAIGFTLFATYASSEAYFKNHLSALSPGSQAIVLPFICGSLAGGAQSLLSAPLDNARLLLLRRQRLLQLHGRKHVVRHGGTAFTGWGSLIRDAISQSIGHTTSGVGSPSTSPTPQQRVSQARQWARRGWSLWTLSLLKDSIAFGHFFAVWESGRVLSRKIAMSWDGQTDETQDSLSVVDEGEEYSDDFEGGTRKRKRSWTSLVIQSFLILVSGGVAGYVATVIGRPFERARGAIWEGRSKWAERDSLQRALEEMTRSSNTTHHGRRSNRGSRPPGSAKRRAVREQLIRRRGVGRTFVCAQRKALKAKAHARHAKALHLLQRREEIRARRLQAGPAPRVPMPSAVSLVRTAARKYGVRRFFFAPSSELRQFGSNVASREVSHLSSSSLKRKLGKAASKVGPTRMSARGRVTQEAISRVPLWRHGTKLLAYVPPYALGFFAFALLQGDLR